MSTQNNSEMIISGHEESHSDYPVNYEMASNIVVFPTEEVKRSDFSEDFLFGAATSAYQIEGGWKEAGKGESIWDKFTTTNPGAIADGSNGRIAIDHYHRFREDVKAMKKLGIKSYRFSIAWTRILPRGRISGGTSRDGIKFYNDLIDELVAAGIEPCATLFHWDTPAYLEQEYQGFLSEKIVQDFCEFAEICFWEFGDRVKIWITLNEPWSYCVQGYVTGGFPPNRGAPPKSANQLSKLVLLQRSSPMATTRAINHQIEGNPGTEPYIVAHNLILCHAHAVNIYRKKYKGLTKSQEDQDAARRAIDFNMGWFVEPQISGDYPESMIRLVGDRLPKFTAEEERLVKGSFDFLGINNYTTNYASNHVETTSHPSYLSDSQSSFSTTRNKIPIGVQAGSKWLYVVPWGIYKLIMFIKKTYKDPVIYITENGTNELNTWIGQAKPSIENVLTDRHRIRYHQDYLYNVKKAINEGARVKAYYIWSLFDNFEWAEGCTVRFGIFFADGYTERLPKDSAIWWQNFLTDTKKPLKKEYESSKERRKRIRNS